MNICTHTCTFACMHKHVYVYTNMYTYTHTHQRVTYLFSRNAKIAAAVTGTITSESHANTRSHTANTYWFGFILIFFFFFQKHKQVPRYTHNRFSGSDPVQNPLQYGCFGWPGRRGGLPSTGLWISAAVLAQWRSCACTVATGDETWGAGVDIYTDVTCRYLHWHVDTVDTRPSLFQFRTHFLVRFAPNKLPLPRAH